MTNFSYYGHDLVLNQGLERKITSSIKKLLIQDDSFTFYFFMEDQFSSCILAAVRELKSKRKNLNIKTILVATHKSVDKHKKYDETILAPNMMENVHFTVNVNRAQKWAIEQADYLLMYLYPCISVANQQILNYIFKRASAGKLSILDLTDDSIIPIINEQFPLLRERQKYVHEQLLSGKNAKELAMEMSITPRRVSEIYKESCSKLFNLTCRAIKNRQEQMANE